MTIKGQQAMMARIIDDIESQDQGTTNLSKFYARLGMKYAEIYENFQELYGHYEKFDEYLIQLFEEIYHGFSNRDDDLKQLDIKREEQPTWFLDPQWVGMQLYVDRFSDNLEGFEEKIPYLQELGVNYVHLMPISEAPEGDSDGGYAVSNYKKIDKRYGTMEDVKRIGQKFREKEMLLELDFVLNHTSNEHHWAKKALTGDKKYQNYYIMYDDRGIPDKFDQSLIEVFPEKAPGNFTYIEAIDQWVMTIFNDFQWDLNYKNPEVFIEILHTLLYLANQGIDILRLDAVPFMWKRLGTVSRNEPEVHMLLKLLKACTSIAAPGLLLKAEAIVQPEEVVKYLGEDECDIAYDFTHMIYLWNSIATQDKKLIERGIQNRPTKPDGTAWINYVRCHDDIGWGFSEQDLQAVGYNPYDHKKFLNDYYTGNFEGSPARGRYFQYNPETEDARITGTTASLLGLEKAIERKDVFEMKTSINKIFLLYSGIMSFGGIPMLYYGDEVGWINDYSYEHDEQRHQDSRWLNRPKINWEKIKERHKLNTVESQIFKGMKKMIDLRKETIEFSGDSHNYRIDNENIHVYSYLRKNGVYKTLVLMNFSPFRQPVHESILWRAGLDDHVYDRFSDQTITIKDNQIILQPYQFCWISKRSK